MREDVGGGGPPPPGEAVQPQPGGWPVHQAAGHALQRDHRPRHRLGRLHSQADRLQKSQVRVSVRLAHLELTGAHVAQPFHKRFNGPSLSE